jgi:hypothetical protein
MVKVLQNMGVRQIADGIPALTLPLCSQANNDGRLLYCVESGYRPQAIV